MDRDMVNCLHYIYRWGEIAAAQLGEIDPRRRLFWCLGDTRQPLGSRNILCENPASHSLMVAPGVYDLLDMVENQLRTMPRPDYAFDTRLARRSGLIARSGLHSSRSPMIRHSTR